MKRDDPFDRTNAASGCTSNDGDVIAAAIREQHRTGEVPLRLTPVQRWREDRWGARFVWEYEDRGRA